MSPRAPDSVRRIAVLRANGIGDLVFALPALDALRRRFHRAEIVLLGREWHAELLCGRVSAIDRVEVLPRSALAGAASIERPEVRAFLDRMRARRFDLGVQLHGGGATSNPLVRALGATTTVGMRTPDADPLDLWIPYVYYQPEIVRYLEVVGLLDATAVTLEPMLNVTPADIAASAATVHSDDGWLVVLHPGATDPRRRWPARAFAAVGDAMHSRGARVVVTGTPEESRLLEDVAASMASAPVVAASTTLSALIGLLARSALVVANDSGPLHLAGAVGTPTVGIYWCGNLVNGGPLSVSRRRHVTSWRVRCPTCGLDCTTGRCEHDDSFVADVAVTDVLSAANDLLERHRPGFDTAVERPPARITRRPADRARGRPARRPRGLEASYGPPGGRRRTA